MIIYDKKIDWEILKYSAARRGLVSCQKSVISFIVDEAGIDTLYAIEISEIKTMENLRKALDDVGLQYRTIVSENKAVIFDSGSNLAENINKLKQKYETTIIKSTKGKGEFVGGETRIEGKSAFQRIIRDYEGRFSGKVQEGEGISNNRIAEAQRIKPGETKPKEEIKPKFLKFLIN